VEQKNDSMIVTREAFQAVGLKWEGTFAGASAGEIRVIHTEMQKRLQEIKHVLNPDKLLGLSYHMTEVGFTHYAVVAVEQLEDIPDGMVTIAVPSLTYAKCEHAKGHSIEKSYNHIYAWIEQQGYKVHQDDMTHFEEYPMQQDPYSQEPEFTIRIPIEK